MNLEKCLKFINEEYLADFDRKEIDAEIKPQEKYNSIKDVEYIYSISEEDDDSENFLALNYVTGRSTDEEVYMDLNLLEYILLEAEGAPLKSST